MSVAADGSYAARLVARGGGGGWCPERWTLEGPEPYAVLLPADQPEEADSPLVPLVDGRVLIGRRTDGRYHFSLLYPSGPDTGELALGAVECERLTLLPPAPDGARVYALAPQAGEGGGTALWLVCGGAFGPELVTVVAGACSGGAWLDGTGRLLALNRTDASGRTRAVTVDVEHGGEPTELLRIAEDSDDRLLLADYDSGLLVVRSDAPGSERIGWGVLGSHRPVRFPESLHQPGVRMTPFAVQPGQVLMPEHCGVALRLTTAEADWVAVWRPQQRELVHLPAPAGWLAGIGRFTVDGDLLLPYVTPQVPCGVARVPVPDRQPGAAAEPGLAAEPVPEAAAPVHEPAHGNESHAPATPSDAPPWTPAREPAAQAPGAHAPADTAPAGALTEAPPSDAGNGAPGNAGSAGDADAALPPPRIEATGPAAPPRDAAEPTGVTRPVPLQQAPLARTR
ncbi:hypothetical protein FH609_002315 [Streptomyces sp. 3MP-14]|uniref:Uncharacterized protein n=1 Tax=Streptomyces mimosae TaxID=2586635 RepID=A0A5N6AQT0_9ACTN|nr:hypothetical protein [Streptomyces sp. 3MP-14]KAB8171197.1 hypothetical protein FH607_000155 [Streptomyces mimosae]KAB8179918.1 hypothetical protein FH609_002315 [Streptomyces sp. 3MP-14]